MCFLTMETTDSFQKVDLILPESTAPVFREQRAFLGQRFSHVGFIKEEAFKVTVCWAICLSVR
jgi:hypothetical protein